MQEQGRRKLTLVEVPLLAPAFFHHGDVKRLIAIGETVEFSLALDLGHEIGHQIAVIQAAQ